MCTLIILQRPGNDWPVLVAANRDEMLARAWQAPAEYWPGIVGGRDTLAGGTWLAVNAAGMVAGVLNRSGSLGPAAGKRSRGDLPLLALRHTTASAAAESLVRLDAGDWRSFNLVVADAADAFLARGLGTGPVAVTRLPAGLSMITASDPNDPAHPRVARHLPRFLAAGTPLPPDWGNWPALLADGGGAWVESLNVPPSQGFGTASAALIGLRPGGGQFLFAAGAPGSAPFTPVVLPGGGQG